MFRIHFVFNGEKKTSTLSRTGMVVTGSSSRSPRNLLGDFGEREKETRESNTSENRSVLVLDEREESTHVTVHRRVLRFVQPSWFGDEFVDKVFETSVHNLCLNPLSCPFHPSSWSRFTKVVSITTRGNNVRRSSRRCGMLLRLQNWNSGGKGRRVFCTEAEVVVKEREEEC